jgi:DNA-binding NarL/FixJ family response regulator
MEQIVARNEECGGEIFELHDVLSGRDEQDPGTLAAKRIDWSDFMAGLSDREKAVINCIAEGRSLREAAKSFRVCDSTMQGDKRKVAKAITAAMGEDILIQAIKLPRWKDDLITSRERLACRHERAH